MIFYFSGTGNTAWAAETIAQSLNEKLVFIPEHIDKPYTLKLAPHEPLGFCFPVHGWRPPIVVRLFIQNLIVESTPEYVYAVCTAGDTIGETVDYLKRDLQQFHLNLNSAFSLIMPESYVGLPFMDVDKKDKEREKKQKALQDLQQYIRIIQERQDNIYKLHIGRWPRINSRIIGAYFVNQLVTDKPFHVKSERCVKCGICADVCPMNDITGGLGYEPVWKHNNSCVTCFSCYHHCPHHAIEFGRQTQKKGQYFYKKNKL